MNRKVHAIGLGSLLFVAVLFGAFFVGPYVTGSPDLSEYYTFENAPYSGYSYVVFVDGSAFYYRDMMSGVLSSASSDDNATIQYCINQSESSGGSVYVKAGSYSASVTLKDNVTLTIEKGASSIAVTIDSGADATLIDYENGYRKEWVSGSLYTFFDVRTGEFWWQGQNRTDLIANPTSETNYIIDTDGTDTWMTNCSTGQRDAVSTNASQIFNWAIGNLTVGGELFIKARTFELDHVWVVDGYNITITGEGFATSLKLADNTNQDVIRIGGTYPNGVGITIEDLYIDGNKANNPTSGSGINIVAILGASRISNVRIKNCREYGIKEEGSGHWNNIFERLEISHCDIGISGGIDSSITNCYIHDTDSYGIQLAYGSMISGCHLYGCNESAIYGSGWGATFNIISGCYIENNNREGIYLYGGPHWNTISSNIIHNNSRVSEGTYAAIRVTGIDGTWTFDNKIEGNIETESGAHSYGVLTEGAGYGTNNVIENNHVQNLMSIRTGDKVYNNVGFVTENWGTESNCINGTYIEHGLAGTPTFISLTVQGICRIDASSYVLDPKVIMTNSTHFQIEFCYIDIASIYAVTATQQRDIDWYAVYEP